MTSYPNPTPSTLFDSHRHTLEVGSAIWRKVYEESGVRSLTQGRQLPPGFSTRQRKRGGGILFMGHRPNGKTFYVYRPDDPDPNNPGLKYEATCKKLGGPGNVLYVHPSTRHLIGTTNVPVIFVEGIKKALAIVTAARAAGVEVLVVAISGVWNWLSGGKSIPDMFDIDVEGREVFIGFDSDVFSNPDVSDAARRLAAHLGDRGATVHLSYLPDGPGGSKTGADDYLARGHTYREYMARMRLYDARDLQAERVSRNGKLQATVEHLERRWWSEEWKGRGGHSERDVALKLIEAAARSGKIHDDGLRVKVSWGTLQVGAKVARRTLAKALDRLQDRGFLYRDNEGRKADGTGAFVLIAKVDQYEGAGPQATPEVRVGDPGSLPSQVPRLRWSRPKWMPRRGTVRGTRKPREGKTSPPQDRIERLGKIRGAVVDALLVAGGRLTLAELCEVLHRSRAYDLARRKRSPKGYDGPLIMLEDAGVIEIAGDAVSLAVDWSERLEGARENGGELDADEKAEGDRKRKSHAYRIRASVKPDRHHANADADGHVEDLRPAEDPPAPPGSKLERPDVSPLAAAVRDYLDRCPHDARRSPYWIGATLWAHELHEGKPTPNETKVAIEELGGAAYLENVLRRARGAA